ncbi:uncharacterized protein N7496_009078 [Penicillium cataractarum]|uniref:Uncharacterized protein n=1 Tax=Penicillium cataractarum TaxID=2100454 RepID=A0A9W9RZL5_9EURO|nr:uncharacterized protein N7496_009078 [Penicillium cataractarum]KAJ5369318.1 hypothetical protein N7496_009078 [Penicillium cataractarum]
MPKKTYLRPANDDYAPDNNIQLGHVWRNPRDPGSFIGDPLPITSEMKINHTRKDSFTINLGRESHGGFALWAKVAQLPLGAAARAHWDNTAGGAYKVPTMDTYSIEPTRAYIEKSVASVSAEILGYGPNLYMVTGVKIARGGEGTHRELHAFGSNIQGGTNAGVYVPVEVGEHFNYSRATHYNQNFGSAGEFVFAYRMREIFYKSGTLKTREYNKGAVLGEDSIHIKESGKGELNIFITEAGIGDDDVEAIGDCYFFTDDDGEACKIVF